jgi:hypothetical protein
MVGRAEVLIRSTTQSMSRTSASWKGEITRRAWLQRSCSQLRRDSSTRTRPVKRAVFPLLMPLVATVLIGRGSHVSAGAATPRPSQFCTSIEPEVQASQHLKPILAGMSTHTVAKTKSQLLTEMNTILSTFRSVEVQLPLIGAEQLSRATGRA